MKFVFSIAAVVATLLVLMSCKKNNDEAGEVWPKTGYVLTMNEDGDSAHVETGSIALTSVYLGAYGVDEPEDVWTISTALTGEGVTIRNNQNKYWSIDSAFHPGLNVEQHFVSIRTVSNTANLSDFERFHFHKADADGGFYLESVRFPGAWVTGLGHAESGRGLRLRAQSSGNWKFWLMAP